MKGNKNYYEFVIKGLNQERFFNKITKKYYVFDVCRYEKNKTSFKVELRNARQIRKEILSSNFEIIGEKKNGFFANILDFKRFFGVFLAFLICFVLYFAQFSFIWIIDVNGVNEDFERKIESYISQNFSLTKSINCKDVEIHLKNEFEDLSFVSVGVVGQTLVVNAKEGIDPVEKNGDFKPITAPFDSRVVSIKLIQGTCFVGEGDSVREGAIIVEPYILDSYGNKKNVEAKAEIVLQTWVYGKESHSEQEYVTKRTGRSYVKNELFLFGLKIYEHNGEKKFCEFECEENEKYFTKNNFLPFIFKKTTFFETKKVLVQKKYEDVKSEKIECAKQKALQKVKESDNIIDERYFENQVGGTYFVEYQITIERELVLK